MPARRPDTLDDEIRRLFQGPLPEFTPTRQALLKRLQKAGDPRAAEVKELRKPTPSAWAVNLLFAHEPQAMAALVKTGVRAHAAIERALAKTDGTEVRAALETIRTESARLAERAAELAGAAGAPPSAAVAERLRANLDALILDPAQAALAERGWLDVDLDAPGFDVLAGLQLAAEKGRGRPEPARPATPAPNRGEAAPAKPVTEDKPGRAEQARRAREEQERARRIAAARAELERLEATAEAARRAVEAAASTADEATAKAAEAATRAELARRAAHDARRAAEAAAGEVVRAREAVRRAESS